MAMSALPLPPLEAATQTDVAFSGKIGDGRLQIGVAIPKQHVQEIMMAVMKMQQSMMQPQQPQQPQQPPTPQPGQPAKPQPQTPSRGQM
jgi:hypothetical protein